MIVRGREKCFLKKVGKLGQGFGALKCGVLALPYELCTLIFENVK